MYMDGLGTESRFGAVATMQNQDGQWSKVRFSLGFLELHIVYKAELAEIIVKLHIANSGRKI